MMEQLYKILGPNGEAEREWQTERLLSYLEPEADDEFVVRMPPVQQYAVQLKVRHVAAATPRPVEPEGEGDEYTESH